MQHLLNDGSLNHRFLESALNFGTKHSYPKGRFCYLVLQPADVAKLPSLARPRMAYLIHLAVALLYLYWSHTRGAAFLNRFVSPLTTLRQALWVYFKALPLLVVLPFIVGELLCIWLLNNDNWNYNRRLILLPYWGVLLSNKTVFTFIRAYFTFLKSYWTRTFQ